MIPGRTSGDKANAANLFESIVALMVVYSCLAQISAMVSAGPTAQPIRNPGNPYALVNLGVALERAGDYEGAIQVYQRFLARAGGQAAGDGGPGYPVPQHLIEIAKENLNHAKNLNQK